MNRPAIGGRRRRAAQVTALAMSFDGVGRRPINPLPHGTEDGMSAAEPSPIATVVVRTDAEIAEMRAKLEHYARIGRENSGAGDDMHAEGALAFCKWICGDLNKMGLLINYLGEGGELP